MADLVEITKRLGLTTKAAKVYLAALELGEASVQQLALKARVKRTTLYYLLDELLEAGALLRVTSGKKRQYVAERPAHLLHRAKERVAGVEDSLAQLEELFHAVRKKPRVYFLYGPSGFKQVWDLILDSPDREYRIITAGENFLDYVKEKYILDEIIAKKKKFGVFSKQLITMSAYARQIIAKDGRENRVSKLLPPAYKLPFTEIITESLVAFISPRFTGMIFVVEDEYFATTRRSVFETLWHALL